MKRKINKIISVYQNYIPLKSECLLFFFIPLLISTITIVLNGNHDIWFLLNHGKYVLKHGFPIIEPFSMHQGLSFVMQQWLSSVIFYIAHSINSTYGLFILCFLINCLILYFLYKLCMEMSNNNYRVSTFISIATDLLLLLYRLIIPRPQIFTYLLLIVTLYIMEKFYKNEKTKAIYFMILISFLQINLHAAMYFMLYIFMLPYMANYIILKIKNKKDNRVFKLLLIWAIMFIVAFINPYGIKAITYIFNSYGNYYVNEMIGEMNSVTISTLNGKIYFSLLIIIMVLFAVAKKGKFKIRQILLFLGLTYLSLTSYRNISLWIIGVIPFIILYCEPYIPKLKKQAKEKIRKFKLYKFIFLIGILLICGATFICQKGLQTYLKPGVDEILKHNPSKKNNIYANYNNGSYLEYRGIKPYIDSRAEVFLKTNNKKEDIFFEYYLLSKGQINYKNFVDKYNFNYLIVNEQEIFYNQIIKDKNYKHIYYGKCTNLEECEYGNYIVLERVVKKNNESI